MRDILGPLRFCFRAELGKIEIEKVFSLVPQPLFFVEPPLTHFFSQDDINESLKGVPQQTERSNLHQALEIHLGPIVKNFKGPIVHRPDGPPI